MKLNLKEYIFPSEKWYSTKKRKYIWYLNSWKKVADENIISWYMFHHGILFVRFFYLPSPPFIDPVETLLLTGGLIGPLFGGGGGLLLGAFRLPGRGGGGLPICWLDELALMGVGGAPYPGDLLPPIGGGTGGAFNPGEGGAGLPPLLCPLVWRRAGGNVLPGGGGGGAPCDVEDILPGGVTGGWAGGLDCGCVLGGGGGGADTDGVLTRVACTDDEGPFDCGLPNDCLGLLNPVDPDCPFIDDMWFFCMFDGGAGGATPILLKGPLEFTLCEELPVSTGGHLFVAVLLCGTGGGAVWLGIVGAGTAGAWTTGAWCWW